MLDLQPNLATDRRVGVPFERDIAGIASIALPVLPAERLRHLIRAGRHHGAIRCADGSSHLTSKLRRAQRSGRSVHHADLIPAGAAARAAVDGVECPPELVRWVATEINEDIGA